MKKWEKYYISITGVIFIITCIISIIFLRNVSHLSEVTVVIDIMSNFIIDRSCYGCLF